MKEQQIILSQFSLDDLKTVFSECVKQELQKFTPQQQPENNSEFIDRKQAGELLGVSNVTLANWTKKGIIKGYKIGTRVRFKKSELIASLTNVKKFGRVAL